MNPKPLLRSALLAAAIVGTALSPVHAAKKREPTNRGMEPAIQPVVQRTDFVFDATPDGYNGLSAAERRRMIEWFDAIGLAYGDRVSIADQGLYARSGVSNAVAGIVGRYGLLLADSAPITAGDVPPGAARIVVSRSTASVPGCPNWRGQYEADIQGGLSFGYGCSVNGNLAAMIANPEDLVRGATTSSDLRTVTSNRAIKAYREAAPTGNGNALK